jgi:hypothetical protein
MNEMWNSLNDNLTADLFYVPTLRHDVTGELLAGTVQVDSTVSSLLTQRLNGVRISDIITVLNYLVVLLAQNMK